MHWRLSLTGLTISDIWKSGRCATQFIGLGGLILKVNNINTGGLIWRQEKQKKPRNGILEVRIPKTEEAKKKAVKIKVEE